MLIAFICFVVPANRSRFFFKRLPRNVVKFRNPYDTYDQPFVCRNPTNEKHGRIYMNTYENWDLADPASLIVKIIFS